jgi:hypothetical protein
MGRRLRPKDYEALRLRTLKVRRDNPDLDYGHLQRRLGMNRTTIAKWCSEAGLDVAWATKQLERRTA